jgi:hypothetical protein
LFKSSSYQQNEKQEKISELDSSQNDKVQITESSWIDWDDKQRLESHVTKQQILESNYRFDPLRYFGGLKVEDLNLPPEDPRLKQMFTNEDGMAFSNQKPVKPA